MKKLFLIIICVFMLIASSITIFILTAPNTKPLYGKFTYANDDGSVTAVILSENTIHFENIKHHEYKNLEKGAAFALTAEHMRENSLPLEFGDEFGQIQQDFMENMDFTNLYEGKEIRITQVDYDETNNCYNYTINNPLDGSAGIFLWVDVSKREMHLSSMVLTYSKK
ncbi:MAG: hypothetical protein FWD34_03120 [Oscillospiraceae bacterium]|nr:hypothetical protein [Oscillospiraceae bacterium]